MEGAPKTSNDGYGYALCGHLTADGHSLMQRVYYEDTDFSGLVYHARYLHFLERGRTDFLRILGVAQSVLANETIFVVRRMTLDFKSPARMDDVLTIETRPQAARGARLVLDQAIRKDDAALVTAAVEIAVLTSAGRPARMPAALAERFARFTGGQGLQ